MEKRDFRRENNGARRWRRVNIARVNDKNKREKKTKVNERSKRFTSFIPKFRRANERAENIAAGIAVDRPPGGFRSFPN